MIFFYDLTLEELANLPNWDETHRYYPQIPPNMPFFATLHYYPFFKVKGQYFNTSGNLLPIPRLFRTYSGDFFHMDQFTLVLYREVIIWRHEEWPEEKRERIREIYYIFRDIIQRSWKLDR